MMFLPTRALPWSCYLGPGLPLGGGISIRYLAPISATIPTSAWSSKASSPTSPSTDSQISSKKRSYKPPRI